MLWYGVLNCWFVVLSSKKEFCAAYEDLLVLLKGKIMRMFFLLTTQDWKLLRLKLQKYMEKVKVAAVALARRETSTRHLLLQRQHTVRLKRSWDSRNFRFIFGILQKFYDSPMNFWRASQIPRQGCSRWCQNNPEIWGFRKGQKDILLLLASYGLKS